MLINSVTGVEGRSAFEAELPNTLRAVSSTAATLLGAADKVMLSGSACGFVNRSDRRVDRSETTGSLNEAGVSAATRSGSRCRQTR